MAEFHKDFTASNTAGKESRPCRGYENGDFPGMNLNLIPADNLFENPFGGNLHRPEGASDATFMRWMA